MILKSIRFLSIVLILNFSSITFALAENKNILAVASSSDSHFSVDLQKQTIIKLDNVVAFDITDNKHSFWKLGSYIFKCGGDTGYNCELFFDKKIVKVDLSREYDVVDFLPYIYQSKVEDYPYKVILVEAGAERGTAWYYAIVLKNNNVIDSFFIDEGRRYFSTTKEYLAKYPEADEMYISPEEFISVFIDDNKQIIFKFDRKYLYPSETPVKEIDKDFLYIHRELPENIKN